MFPRLTHHLSPRLPSHTTAPTSLATMSALPIPIAGGSRCRSAAFNPLFASSSWLTPLGSVGRWARGGFHWRSMGCRPGAVGMQRPDRLQIDRGPKSSRHLVSLSAHATGVLHVALVEEVVREIPHELPAARALPADREVPRSGVWAARQVSRVAVVKALRWRRWRETDCVCDVVCAQLFEPMCGHRSDGDWSLRWVRRGRVS